MSIRVLGRSDKSYRTEKDVLFFSFVASDETLTHIPYQTGTFTVDSMKVVRELKDDVESLHISVWGRPVEDVSNPGAAQWSTKVPKCKQSHMDQAPAWVRVFIGANTGFGHILDASKEQA
jgi:hypothetical protein